MPGIFQLPEDHLDFYQDELVLPGHGQIIAKAFEKVVFPLLSEKKQCVFLKLFVRMSILFHEPKLIYIQLQSNLINSRDREGNQP